MMLRADDDRIDAYGPAVLVLDGHLALSVGTQIGQSLVLADFGEAARKAARKLMRERYGQRHQLLGLVAGVADHKPLVARSNGVDFVVGKLLRFLRLVHAERYVARLLIYRREHRAGVPVEAILRARVADFLDRLARDLRDVDVAVRGLARDAAHRVRLKYRVENGVGYLICEFVRVPFRHRFRRNKIPFFAHIQTPPCGFMILALLYTFSEALHIFRFFFKES